MQRVTLTLDDDLVDEVDALMRVRGYQSRSEAVRDILRAGLPELAAGAPTAATQCVAALVFAYDRGVRDLPKRLAESRADHHHLIMATTTVDLDHTSCFEVSLLRGETDAVRHLGGHVCAERGVRHGRLVIVPVDIEQETHRHGPGQPQAHAHIKVRQS